MHVSTNTLEMVILGVDDSKLNDVISNSIMQQHLKHEN